MVTDKILKKLDNIVEACYELENCPLEVNALIKESFKYFLDHGFNYSDYKYYRIVHDKNCTIMFNSAIYQIPVSNYDARNDKICFVETLRKYNRFKFSDLLYFSSLIDNLGDDFNPYDPFNLNDEDEEKNFYSEYLKDTHGKIVYANQFEYLYQMATGKSFPDATIARKNWNTCESSIKNGVFNIYFEDGKNFGELLKERMVSTYFTFPNLKKAKLLYEFLHFD